MKILFLVDEFPPFVYTSGARAMHFFAIELEKRGHEVSVITSVQDKKSEGEEVWNGLNIFRIYSNYHPRWRNWFGLYNPQTISKIEKIIKEIKPDIINTRHIHTHLSFYSFKVAKKYAKAVFFMVNNVLLFSYAKLPPKNGSCFYKVTTWERIKQARKRYNPFRGLIIRYCLRYVDKILAVSEAMKKLLEMNGIKNKIDVIYNGMNVIDWELRPEKIMEFKERYNLLDKKILFFGGRLSGSKGGNEILESLDKIKSEIKNIVLLVVGEENQYVEQMRTVVKKMNLENQVIFTDWLGGDELRAAYHSADIVVVPSCYFDPLPMTNFEAMACKKPVVGTVFGGTPELVKDGITGYVINPLDTDLMARKITDLLKNPQKARQFGEAGYDLVKTEFSIERQVDKILEQYQKFL
jgi:glycosyltransferase involved in cell wall biosynthesis